MSQKNAPKDKGKLSQIYIVIMEVCTECYDNTEEQRHQDQSWDLRSCSTFPFNTVFNGSLIVSHLIVLCVILLPLEGKLFKGFDSVSGLKV